MNFRAKEKEREKKCNVFFFALCSVRCVCICSSVLCTYHILHIYTVYAYAFSSKQKIWFKATLTCEHSSMWTVCTFGVMCKNGHWSINQVITDHKCRSFQLAICFLSICIWLAYGPENKNTHHLFGYFISFRLQSHIENNDNIFFFLLFVVWMMRLIKHKHTSFHSLL